MIEAANNILINDLMRKKKVATYFKLCFLPLLSKLNFFFLHHNLLIIFGLLNQKVLICYAPLKDAGFAYDDYFALVCDFLFLCFKFLFP